MGRVEIMEEKIMPVITAKLAKGRTVEQKQRFVEAITKEAGKTLNVKALLKQNVDLLTALYVRVHSRYSYRIKHAHTYT